MPAINIAGVVLRHYAACHFFFFFSRYAFDGFCLLLPTDATLFSLSSMMSSTYDYAFAFAMPAFRQSLRRLLSRYYILLAF